MSEKSAPALYTERLVLREFTEDDLPEIFEIFSDEEVNTFLPWFPLKTPDEAKAFYEERYARHERKYQYAICLKSDNKPIGYINISANESNDLGYGLLKEFWNRGIVTEAGKALLEQARADGLPYVTATHDRENPRSGRVMQKLGMKYHYSYDEDWQPKNKLVTFRMYQLNLDGNETRVFEKYLEMFPKNFVEDI